MLHCGELERLISRERRWDDAAIACSAIPLEPALVEVKCGDNLKSGVTTGVVTSVSESERREVEDDISLAEELRRDGGRDGVGG